MGAKGTVSRASTRRGGGRGAAVEGSELPGATGGGFETPEAVGGDYEGGAAAVSGGALRASSSHAIADLLAALGSERERERQAGIESLRRTLAEPLSGNADEVGSIGDGSGASAGGSMGIPTGGFLALLDDDNWASLVAAVAGCVRREMWALVAKVDSATRTSGAGVSQRQVKLRALARDFAKVCFGCLGARGALLAAFKPALEHLLSAAFLKFELNGNGFDRRSSPEFIRSALVLCFGTITV
ncbi:hypothetical protein HK405_008570 [Cladochytrium tenue]|nr:hypothetical protein HK405_008570 [Cladochytrium tenue]